MKPPFSVRFSRSFGEFLLFIVFTIVFFFMRKSGPSFLYSCFLKLGCYCSRILIHILSFSYTRLQQQAMAGITQCSKILIRILSFCNTRLQQQVVAGITHGKLSDQFFCLDAYEYEYEYFMVVKGYVHTVPVVKRSVTETERYSVNRQRVLQCDAK